MVKRVPSNAHYALNAVLAATILWSDQIPQLVSISGFLSWVWVVLLGISTTLVLILYNVTQGWIRDNKLENFVKYKNAALTFVTLHSWEFSPITILFVWIVPLVLAWYSGNQLQAKAAAIIILGYLALKIVFNIGYKSGKTNDI